MLLYRAINSNLNKVMNKTKNIENDFILKNRVDTLGYDFAEFKISQEEKIASLEKKMSQKNRDNMQDLDNNNREGLKELGSVDINDWDGLAELLNEEEANLHKEDFAMEELTYLVFLYSEGRYVTSIQANEE